MTEVFSKDLDRIILKGVRGVGFHGLLPEERATGQEFVVDVILGVMSIAKAAKTDDLAHTVDYAGIATSLVEIIEGPAVNLIETLATRIAEHCLEIDFVRAVTVTVHKPSAPIPVPFSDVAVRITRVR